MNLISKLLPPSNIVLDLEVSSKKRMFEQAGLIFENNQGVARSLVFDSLFARERLGSTGLGQGVAIPHGRIKGLREPVAAFVRLGSPVPFDAPDGKIAQILSEQGIVVARRTIAKYRESLPIPPVRPPTAF